MVLVCLGCNPAKPPETEERGQPVQTPPRSTTNATPPPTGGKVSLSFTDRTADSGINFQYRNGEEADRYAILESLGGGLALIDFDRDGREDLCIAGGGRFDSSTNAPVGVPLGLFRNLGVARFAAVGDAAMVAGSRYYHHGIICADYDGDGFPDFLVTGYGGLQLYRNLGDGTFEEVAESAGLQDRLWSSAAAWGDLNGDGHLDLFVVHYVDWSDENDPLCPGPPGHPRDVCPPRSFQGLPDTLYLSRGDGTFVDVSTEMNLRRDAKGLGVLIADLDLDGDLDIYVTNDTVENHLYRNDSGERLVDVSLISGTSLSQRGMPDGSMGVGLLDYNLDGLPDLWVVNYEEESAALYRNEGQLMFQHVSEATGVAAVGGMYVGWGTVGTDLNLDGLEELVVSNGHVIRYPTRSTIRQQPLLLKNQGQGQFRNIASSVGGYFQEQHPGRGVVAGDLFQNGKPDLVFSAVNAPVRILENSSEAQGNWLLVDLIGTVSPRDAIGAVVELELERGKLVRHWFGGGSYLSTGSRPLHFGLPTGQAVLSLRVKWPSGIDWKTTEIPLNSRLQIAESALSSQPLSLLTIP